MTPPRLPTLVVISGPPGAGKTTLAHELALAIGCPAICRDELKEGMAHAMPGYAPTRDDDPLPLRTLTVFFGVLEVLLSAGVSVVAESAFQDRLWRPGLEPMRAIASVRVVHCVVEADIAYARRLERAGRDRLRAVHEPPGGMPTKEQAMQSHGGFQPISIDVPAMTVDTTDGYRPGLAAIVAFVNSSGVEGATPRPLRRP